MEIIAVTDSSGRVIEPQWLERAQGVHRQLREHLPPAYAAKMRRVFEGGGRMCVAARGESVAGVAVYRISENTFDGRKLYVDDLVTDASERSTGVGRALLEYLEGLARTQGCETLTLDSGTQRQRAHRFYFREGMLITAFVFKKKL